jgi:hypothetical protein
MVTAKNAINNANNASFSLTVNAQDPIISKLNRFTEVNVSSAYNAPPKLGSPHALIEPSALRAAKARAFE